MRRGAFLLIGALVMTILFGLPSIAFLTSRSTVRIAVEGDNGVHEVGSLTAFLYDESGDLLSKRTLPSLGHVDLTIPSRFNHEEGLSQNYVLRVIADDGSVGILHFSDREVKEYGALAMSLIPRPQDHTVSAGSLSEGMIVREGVYPMGAEFTTIGELHAAGEMWSTVTLTNRSEAGIEARFRWVGDIWGPSIGYVFRRVNYSQVTSQPQVNPTNSPIGGRYIKTEYTYKIEVWAQYDANGFLVSRWEELKVDSLVGGLMLEGAVGGDMESYPQVDGGQYGSRVLLQGGSCYHLTYNASHTYSVAVNIVGAQLGAVTAYHVGSRVNFYLWRPFQAHPEDHYSMYAAYSQVGTAYSNTFPVVYWTHNWTQ